MKTPSDSSEWKNTQPSIAQTTRLSHIEAGAPDIDRKILHEYLKCKSLVSVLKKKVNAINLKKPYKTMVLEADRLQQEVKNSKSRTEYAAKNKLFMDNQVEIAEMETLVHELQGVEKRVLELETIEPRLNPVKKNYDIV